jgi:hypothetical protein
MHQHQMLAMAGAAPPECHAQHVEGLPEVPTIICAPRALSGRKAGLHRRPGGAGDSESAGSLRSEERAAGRLPHHWIGSTSGGGCQFNESPDKTSLTKPPRQRRFVEPRY